MRTVLMLVGAVLAAFATAAAPHTETWSAAEQATLASMQLARLPAPPADPSNAQASNPAAVALGERLFADVRLSADGRVSCATCHVPERGFQDGRPVGQGMGTGSRRTMPIAAAGHGPWLFWDGRKDSLWSQALGPLEDAAEHGGNRVQLVRLLHAHHRAAYEVVFGSLPPLQGLPAHASPLGSPAERQAWAAMTEPQRQAVNRAFANLGKAIAAFERTIVPAASRFDRYVRAVLEGDVAGLQVLTAQEANGLRLFIGRGQCATCHGGPLLSDQHFHNTGVPARLPASPDRGRAAAIAKVLADEFNCLGLHSDAPPAACRELAFVAGDDAAMQGAFKTPGLRGVAERAPYMHAGQFATLEQVVAHYRQAPPAPVGQSELVVQNGPGHAGRTRIRLTDAEARDVVAFLRTLSAWPVRDGGSDGRLAPRGP